MLYGIERLAEKQIRIGPEEFKLGVCDKPLPDGTYMGVDAAGRPYSEHQQQLDLELFRGAFAYQLFKGLYIGIYSPVVLAPNIGYLELRNPYGTPILGVALTYTYATWEGDSNLNNFCKHLCGNFLKQIPNCLSAHSAPEDVCVNISLPLTFLKLLTFTNSSIPLMCKSTT